MQTAQENAKKKHDDTQDSDSEDESIDEVVRLIPNLNLNSLT